MPYTFTFTEATGADKYDAREIGDAAFKDSIYRQAWFPPHLAHLTSPEELKEWRLSTIQGIIDIKHSKPFKAIAHDDVSGVEKMIGYAIWLTPDFNRNEESIRGYPSKPVVPTDVNSDVTGITPVQKSPEDKPPACIDAEIFGRQITAADEMREQVWGKNPPKYWYLLALAVHPDFHRNGIAKMLVKWGLDMADRDGLPVYLEATPNGMPLYEHMGFEKVAETNLLDNASYAQTAMKRMPKV